MKVRQIRPSEREHIARVYNNAYRIPLVTAQGWAKSAQLTNTRGIFEGKRLVSMLQIVPFKIWLGGKVVDMGGIGGVATWADCQGRGYASVLMSDSLETMRKRKQWVSVLYPFSHRYYAKFGWAIAGHRIKYRNVKQHEIVRFAERSMVTADEKDITINALDKVYSTMAREYNLCARRTQKMWKQKLDSLKKSNGQMYVIKDGNEYIGWFTCRNIKHGHFFESLTNEFAYANETALKAMMGFLATLPTNVTSITIVSPYAMDLWDYFKEPFIETVLKTEMQCRVVDVPRAVKARGYPDNVTGKINISIEDKAAEWNSATWSCEIKNGKIIGVKKSDKKPHVSCSIQAFSQLFSGYTTADRLAWKNELEVHNPGKVQLLNAMFHDKPTCMLDWF